MVGKTWKSSLLQKTHMEGSALMSYAGVDVFMHMPAQP